MGRDLELHRLDRGIGLGLGHAPATRDAYGRYDSRRKRDQSHGAIGTSDSDGTHAGGL